MSLLPKKPVMEQEFIKTAAHVNYATVGRKLTESVREYKTAAVVTPLLVLGEVVFEVMIPLYTADLIDAIKSGADLSQILSTGGRARAHGARLARLRRRCRPHVREGLDRLREEPPQGHVL